MRAEHDAQRYDLATRARILRDAGFTTVERTGNMESPHPELRVDESSAHAKLTRAGHSLNLFVEAS